jgi:hypothetical protein
MIAVAGRTASIQRLQGAIVGALASILLVGGTALATTSSPSVSAPIQACVNGTTRVLTVPRRGHTCPVHSFPLSWNKAGPVGPRGPAGIPGPAGPVFQVTGSVTADCKQFFPNPNYSTTAVGGPHPVCELSFPDSTHIPLVIISPIGAGVSVTREDPAVCAASIPGACTVGYALSSPAQIYFVADVSGGQF